MSRFSLEGKTAIVTGGDQVDNIIAKTVEAFGAVDVIVNNAGRWGSGHEAEDTPLDEWRDVVEQNLTGVFIPFRVWLKSDRFWQ